MASNRPQHPLRHSHLLAHKLDTQDLA